jgi:hypothetical protein
VDAFEFGELGLVIDAEGFLEGVGLGGDTSRPSATAMAMMSVR